MVVGAPPAEVLRAFGLRADLDATPVSGGLIHGSWHAPDLDRPLLLQRFATHVFSEPALVAANIRRVSRQLAATVLAEGADPARLVLQPVDTRDGSPYAPAADGTLWRAARWIGEAVVHERAVRPELAYAAAFAFADFQRRLQPLQPPLAAVLPGFHDTEMRRRRFEQAVDADSHGRAAQCATEIAELRAEAVLAPIFGEAQAAGRLPLRTVHNDAKLANLLFDARTGAPLAVVDLDTTGPGTALVDLGDLLRSTASAFGEQAEDPAEVEARPRWIEAVLTGWRDAMGDAMTEAEQVFLPLAGVVLAYEQALRFLTDYLQGDTYYLVDHPERNLRRCRSQLALLRSFHAQKDLIRRACGV